MLDIVAGDKYVYMLNKGKIENSKIPLQRTILSFILMKNGGKLFLIAIYIR